MQSLQLTAMKEKKSNQNLNNFTLKAVNKAEDKTTESDGWETMQDSKDCSMLILLFQKLLI